MNRWNQPLIVTAVIALIAGGTTFSDKAFAASGGSIAALNVQTIADSSNGSLGTLRVTVPAGIQVKNGDKVIIKLPKNVELKVDEQGLIRDPLDFDGENQLIIPQTFNGASNPFADLNGGDLALEVVYASKDEFHIGIKLDSSTEQAMLTNDGVFFVKFGDVSWSHLSDGPVEATVEASSASAFPSGKAALANVESSRVSAKASSQTSDFNFRTKLTLVESTPGSLKIGKESLEVQLPPGFEWTVDEQSRKISALHYGEDIYVRISSNGRKLMIDFLGTVEENINEAEVQFSGQVTSEISQWEIPNLTFQVINIDSMKPGPIMAKLSGKTTTEQSELRVGVYGETGVVATASEPTTIVAGQDEQKIADITFKESLAKSLVLGRTITLTLPEGARFQPVYEGKTDQNPAGDTTDNNEGLKLTFIGYNRPDLRKATFEVTGETASKVGEFTLKDMEVALAADFAGDLEIELGGSAGVSGKVKVAEVLPPIRAEANEIVSIGIGVTGQTVGELKLTETTAGNFLQNGTVSLELPKGVTFSETPSVKVTAGDVGISNVRRANDNQSVVFEIDYESTEPSEITVSGIKLSSDRATPEGDVWLKINGTALFETKKYSDWNHIDAVSKVAIAKVSTPAPKEIKRSAKFIIDSPYYEINGEQKKMEVTPYIRDGRTYLPIRYVAEALGVSDDQIIWNDETKTVTFIRGERVVQLSIGETTLIINGTKIEMDAAAEINKGRTSVPVRFIAQAFGAEVDWDESASAVILR